MGFKINVLGKNLDNLNKHKIYKKLLIYLSINKATRYGGCGNINCEVHWYVGLMYKKPPWSREPSKLLDIAGVNDISVTVEPVETPKILLVHRNSNIN